MSQSRTRHNGDKEHSSFCTMIKATSWRGKKERGGCSKPLRCPPQPALPSYRLSWGLEPSASCELCLSWRCSSPRRCSCPHRRAPPWRCRGSLSAGRRNAGCLAGQSTGTRWKPMHTWGLQDKRGGDDVIQGEDYTLGQPNTSLNADSSAG